MLVCVRARSRGGSSGFSLLELLAVVTIIGILAAVVIPRIGGQTRTAKQHVCNQYVADLNSAIERFWFERQAFPGTLNELHPDFYPEQIPVCPATQLPYAMDAVSHRVSSHTHP